LSVKHEDALREIYNFLAQRRRFDDLDLRAKAQHTLARLFFGLKIHPQRYPAVCVWRALVLDARKSLTA
jgi:hypothetical protein